MEKKQNFYEVLGVAANAEYEEIRNAYLSKARKVHPDTFNNSPKEGLKHGEASMIEINLAWSVLSDPDSRKTHDQNLLGQGEQPSSAMRTPWSYSQAQVQEPKLQKQVKRYATHKEMQLSGFAKIVRPMPLISLLIVVLVVLGIVAFVGSSGNNATTKSVPIPTGVPLACMDFVAGSKGEEVPCGNHDAVIWETVPAGESCPGDLYEVFNGRGGLFCFTYSEDQ